MGEIAFLDRSGGGTHVRISFDTEKLAGLEGDGEDENSDSDEFDSEEEA